MFTGTGRVCPISKALRGRRLVVVDIENVVGGAVLAIEQARGARASVHEVVSLSGCEQVVIGTSHVGVLATGLGWSGSRIVAHSGIDGADKALLQVLTHERVEERFDEIVLVSGDGIFADVVALLGAAGVRVMVVARRGGCSKRLRMAAAETILLDTRELGIGGAA